MTIALGAAELLRASWAEINLHHEIGREVPSGVRDAVNAKVNKPTSSSAIGLHLATEEFSKGLRQAGVDIAGSFAIAPPWSLTLRLGGREAFSVSAPDGVIRANAWLIGTGAFLRLTPENARAIVAATVHVDCVRQQFFAEPAAGAAAATGSGTGYLASVGAFGGTAIGSIIQLDAEVNAGTVLAGVSARDAARVVLAMNGAWVGASLGISLRTW